MDEGPCLMLLENSRCLPMIFTGKEQAGTLELWSSETKGSRGDIRGAGLIGEGQEDRMQ